LHPDGEPWDVDGSPPDQVVLFGVDTEELCRTETAHNAWRVTWDVCCDFVFQPGYTFEIGVYDEDVDELEYGFHWEWSGDAELAEITRLRGLVLEARDPSGRVQVGFTSVPHF